MRKVLLDTHALLWWLGNDARLGVQARAIITDERNEVFVSAASTWEIAIKTSLGKLSAPGGLDAIIGEEGFSPLPISLFHGQQAGSLPPLHRDPFDRMLVAQAQAEGLELMTANADLAGYGVRLVDASI